MQYCILLVFHAAQNLSEIKLVKVDRTLQCNLHILTTEVQGQHSDCVMLTVRPVGETPARYADARRSSGVSTIKK